MSKRSEKPPEMKTKRKRHEAAFKVRAALRALKADPLLSGVPIVFLTATVRKSEVDARGGVLGGYPFLAKPASTEAIVQFIDKHLPL